MDYNSNATNPQEEREQTLTLVNRRRFTVSGVTEVLRFDDTAAAFDTVKGRLVVRGEGLRVETMDVEAGNVTLNGTVSALGFTGDGSEKGGVFGKLFR